MFALPLYDHRYEVFRDFVEEVAGAGCRMFVVHARNAWLKGLSPKENREVPPLRYDWAYALKRERPELAVIVNGGIATQEEATAHLDHADGAMLGRAAYHDPWPLHRLDAARFGGELRTRRAEEHTSELQSLMRISYAVFCLKKKKQ